MSDDVKVSHQRLVLLEPKPGFNEPAQLNLVPTN